MTYQTASFSGFGAGLNLTAKEDAVSEAECIDAMNVEFSSRGAVKQRAGYGTFATSLTARPNRLLPVYYTSGSKQLVVGSSTRLEVRDDGGSLVGSAVTGLSSGTWDFARFGAPGSEYVYAGNGTDTIRRWNGSTWSAPSNMPKGGALAVQSVDQGNRLIAGRFEVTNGGPTGGAGTSNPSRVYFSDAGDPETWGINNYVDFYPGDGEKIQAIRRWGEFVFIFKETKFFVVYGTSTDTAGEPVLNWRTVDTGAGAISPRGVAVSRDGVYFASRRGIFRTTGAEPQLVSGQIDPIFDSSQTPSAFWQGGRFVQAYPTNLSMCEHNERIYVAITTSGSTNDKVLVFDTNQGWWSIWDLKADCLTSFRPGSQQELMFGYATGDNTIGRLSSSYTSDGQLETQVNGAQTPTTTLTVDSTTGFASSGTIYVGGVAITYSGKTSTTFTGCAGFTGSVLDNTYVVQLGAAIEARWRSGWFDYGSPVMKTIRESKIWGGGAFSIAVSKDFELSAGISDSVDFSEGSATQWNTDYWSGGEWEKVAGLTPHTRRRAVQGTTFSTSFFNSALNKSFAIHRLTHHLREFRIPSTESRTES